MLYEFKVGLNKDNKINTPYTAIYQKLSFNTKTISMIKHFFIPPSMFFIKHLIHQLHHHHNFNYRCSQKFKITSGLKNKIHTQNNFADWFFLDDTKYRKIYFDYSNKNLFFLVHHNRIFFRW